MNPNLQGVKESHPQPRFALHSASKVLNQSHPMKPNQASRELHWEFKELCGNLQNPTQMLSYDEMNYQPLHLANTYFTSAKILFVKICCEAERTV